METKSSDSGDQLFPESVVFQIPPDGDPTYKVFGSVGSSATQFMRPLPGFHPVGLVHELGPSGIQLPDLACDVAYFASNFNRS